MRQLITAWKLIYIAGIMLYNISVERKEKCFQYEQGISSHSGKLLMLSIAVLNVRNPLSVTGNRF